MKAISLFAIGVLFGLGLVVSGMAQPEKVTGFLDVFGAWDPSLAFVMGSALLVTHFGFNLILKKPSPVFDSNFRLPTANQIDSRLLIGATFFGVGWGLSGFCPGPAFVALGTGHTDVVIFVLAMFAGFSIKDMVDLVLPNAAVKA
ncbi:MAG: DUF6691 family protein [Pseudomonadota bacterium]